jgi:outer membrane receptor protein involved in Fe transport
LTAAYAMFTNNITPKFKAVWGFRMEYFDQKMNIPNKKIDTSYYDPINGVVTVYNTVDSIYATKYFSGITQSDSNGAPVLNKHGVQKSSFPLLPSINLIYSLNDKMNLRFSYGQTITRPEFRELAAFHYFDFVSDAGLAGNPNLQQTLIHNFDLRYEYFLGKGQVVNATIFGKKFKNTIEQTAIANGSSQEFQYNNASSAFLVGAEVEFRKRLGFIHESLDDLQFISNFAYIYSSVDVSKIKNNAGDESKRSMQGQSPFIINLGLMYQHPKIGFGATLLYNQIGHRLAAIGEVGNPSWYENSRPILDFQVSQKIGKYITLKLTMSDLIAAPQIFYQNAANTPKTYQKDKDFIVKKEQNYRGYNFQMNFSF